MKQKWSKSWVSSKQPRKQRKYRYNAPLHIRHKFVSAHLSKELIERFNTRSLPLRKGDFVEIMRGEFKGLKGKIEKIDLTKCKVYIENIKVKKVDGSEVKKAIEPSNLRIVRLNLDDKRRQKIFERFAKKETKSKEVKKKKTKKESE